MAFSLAGHVAVVTGSSRGLGKAIALTLGKAGARIAVNYFNDVVRAKRTFAEFKEAKIDSVLVKADVISEEGVDRLFRETEAKLGRPDILVVNATPAQPLKPIEEYDWAFYQTMLDFFVKSPFLLTRRGLAHMKATKWGRIVNITSEVFQRSVAPFSAYVAAKGGQVGWSRSMANRRPSASRSTWWRLAGFRWSGTRRIRRKRRTPIALIPAGRWARRRTWPTPSSTWPARRRHS